MNLEAEKGIRKEDEKESEKEEEEWTDTTTTEREGRPIVWRKEKSETVSLYQAAREWERRKGKEGGRSC